MLIDSHCHLTAPPLRMNLEAVLSRAQAAGVSHAISIGTDAADVRAVLELAQSRPEVFAAAGVHPHEAGKMSPGWLDELEALARDPRVVAVGETGLDYHYDFADRRTQRTVFEAELGLAERLGKPVIIHCREAHADAVAALAGVPRLAGVVFHCFTGTRREAAEILDRGWWLSLTGVVTFKNAGELREAARMVPDSRLMVETDAPYLSPEPVRSVRPNEPAFVAHTARRLAEARGVRYEQFVAQTRANTIRFFRLPLD